MDELGRYLRAAREAAGLSIEQLSRETRIPIRTLEGLEEGLREGLPERVFLRGFVQAVCRCCAVDPGPALELLAGEGRSRARAAGRSETPQTRPSGAPVGAVFCVISNRRHIIGKSLCQSILRFS